MECFVILAALSFVFGSYIASFLNVCIWRIPREESVVRPPSHCPKCNARIRWHQNIPIVSWIALKGRCANCKAPISARYVIVELLGGVLFLLVYLQCAVPFFLRMQLPMGLVSYEDVWMVPVGWLVVTGLILGAFIDFDHQYLPDRVTIGGMLLGVPLSFAVPELQGETLRLTALCWSLGGMAIGFCGLWTLGWLASKAFKKDAMGFGDVKLLGAIGAFFGPWAILFTVLVSSFVGSVVGIGMLVRGKARIGEGKVIPYGPFLAIGVLAWMFWGRAVVSWYTGFSAFGR